MDDIILGLNCRNFCKVEGGDNCLEGPLSPFDTLVANKKVVTWLLFSEVQNFITIVWLRVGQIDRLAKGPNISKR